MEAFDRHAVVYPTSDGERMSENTLQFEWITRLVLNLDAIRPDFVAGDLLWYPVEGDPKTRVAPDALVCIGRPKGHRGAWLQWQEDGVAPRFVVEVLSPGNTIREMLRKLAFYDQHGVHEFVILDPMEDALQVYVRADGRLVEVPVGDGWTSPSLGVRFVPGSPIEVFAPDGSPFLTFGEVMARARTAEANAERAQADAERAQADAERAQADAERAQADAARAQQRAEALAAKLRAAGIDPDA